METLDCFDALLRATHNAHLEHPEAMGFAPSPTDVTSQVVGALTYPANTLLQHEAGFGDSALDTLKRAVVTVGNDEEWPEHLLDSDIGQNFRDRFGGVSIMGDNGPFTSAALRAWIVYTPPNQY